MGSRAGFIVKRSGATKAYGSRHAGSSVVNWLLRGPEKATAKFVGTGELDDIDDVLGGEDGAALIDWDDKVVLWMMANAWHPIYQRLCNRMISQAFSGWNVRMAHDLYEISEQAGVSTSQYIHSEPDDGERDWGDYSQEEIDEQLAAEEAAKRTTAEDVWEPAEAPEILESFEQIDSTGDWVTIRKADGSIKDYFGFGSQHNDLLKGEQFAKDLDALPSLDRIPPELVTDDCMLIDWTDKTLWRMHISSVALQEEQYAKQWPGWTMKQIPGGNWAGQVELTGRQPGDRATSERELLGITVAELAPVHAQEGPALGDMIAKTRMGCGGTTVLLALAALAVYFWIGSTGGAIALGVLFLISCFLTKVVFAKTRAAIDLLDLTETPQAQCEQMDRILDGLGYPSIAQLKESGEIPAFEGDSDQEDDGDEVE